MAQTDQDQTDRERPRRRVARHGLRVVAAVLSLVCVFVLVLVAGLAWRLTRGPIALPDWTVARIEARIARAAGPRQLELGEVALAYDVDAKALRLRLRGAALSEGGAPLVILPEARVSLDGGALLQGRLRPRRVAIDGLRLDVARDAEGRFSIAFGAGGDLPVTWKEALDALDAALDTPVIAELVEVEATGLEMRFSDAVTGLSQTVRDGRLTWRRDGEDVRLSLGLDVPLGDRTARAAASLTRNRDGRGAEAEVALNDLSLAGLARAVPNVAALTLATGEVSGRASITLSEDGVPGPLIGRIEAVRLHLTDRPSLALDRAALGFDWLPGSGRIGLSEVAAASPDLSLDAGGQVLLEDGLVGPVQVQLRLGRTVLDPEGLFDRRAEFDAGVIEARLTQSPLALRIGQAMVDGPSGTARLSGRVAFVPDGLAGALRLAVPRMRVDQLAALWPPTLAAKSRDWFTGNLLGGTATGATGLVRFAPDKAPELLASLAFESGTFRYMRFMPPAEEVTGALQFEGNRLSVRMDHGTVPAVGPDGPVGDGRIDISGSTFAIPDATQRPAEGLLALTAAGGIGDMLTLLDNEPFRLLDRLGRTRDLASGRAEARVAVRLPLRSGNAPADIDYEVTATLRQAQSRELIPDRVLAADSLTLTVVPGRVAASGDVTLEGVPFSGTWSQALPPPATEPIDPDAPPKPPEPLPQPGRVEGVATLDPGGLDRLGISVAAFDLAGETTARIAVDLPRGGDARLTATSDLRGMAVGLPVIGWSKARGGTGALSVDARLGKVPEVTRVTLAAPGLSASGRVTFRAGGGLDRAVFGRIDTGWFEGPVTLTGRGSGVTPAIAIGGGTADLKRALASIDTGGGGGAAPAPLDIALSRLTVTDGIALTDLRTSLRRGGGRFTARVNGGAGIEGVIGPEPGGTAVQIKAADAGAVLRSAGLFEDARGGALDMTLRPAGPAGTFDGALRIANINVRDVPALAVLLQALSVVGILEQLGGAGLPFTTVESDFLLRPGDIQVRYASAVGPSLSITARGAYDTARDRMDLHGVISPIYLVNGLFGALFGQRDEGLFGFNYRLTGPAGDPSVSVNPLSILTPGGFREIFRQAPPS